jgi:hypothetical protein
MNMLLVPEVGDDDVHEDNVRSKLEKVVCDIIDALESTFKVSFVKLGFCVGGICADYTLAVKGKTGPTYFGADGRPALISAYKTGTSRPTGEPFHL